MKKVHNLDPHFIFGIPVDYDYLLPEGWRLFSSYDSWLMAQSPEDDWYYLTSNGKAILRRRDKSGRHYADVNIQITLTKKGKQ